MNVLGRSLGRYLDEIVENIKKNWYWPSPAVGLSLYTLKITQTKLPFDLNYSFYPDSPDNLGRLDQAPILAAYGYYIAINKDNVSGSLLTGWANGLNRLSVRNPFPQDRASFFYRTTELLGICLGIINCPLVTTDKISWFHNLILEGESKCASDGLWDNYIRAYSAKLLNSTYKVKLLPLIEALTIEELSLLKWFCLVDKTFAERLGINKYEDEVENALLEKCLLATSVPQGEHFASLLYVSLKSSVNSKFAKIKSSLSTSDKNLDNSESSHNRKSKEDLFDIAVICALQEPEFQKMKNVNNGSIEWVQFFQEDDPHVYHKTEFTSKNGSIIRIVAGIATQMGMTATAVLTTKIILKFQPQFVIMVGIAAGTRQENRNFGDILVADIAFDYGSGKIKKGKDGAKIFDPDPHPISIHSSLLSVLQSKKANRDYLDDIRNKWQGNKPNSVLNIHIGPVGSGASVIDNIDNVQEIQSHWRKLVGIEMETYAVYFSAKESTDKPLYFISFKSVCDFAEEKEDSWQNYAAYTAAEYCYRFIINDLWDRFAKK